jgi:hypothetical protein
LYPDCVVVFISYITSISYIDPCPVMCGHTEVYSTHHVLRIHIFLASDTFPFKLVFVLESDDEMLSASESDSEADTSSELFGANFLEIVSRIDTCFIGMTTLKLIGCHQQVLYGVREFMHLLTGLSEVEALIGSIQ